MKPLARIPVGVVVECRKATSPWIDFVWRPVKVLEGAPETEAWTPLSADDDATTYYAGGATIDLYPSETIYYRDNLASATPGIWVVLRPTGSEPAYTLLAVTANPDEGEAYSQPGTDLVDAVAMPKSVREMIAAFIAEHHVEQPFYKRKRDRANSEPLGRRAPGWQSEDE
jgi:uncharacterized protein DUF3305